MKTFHLVFSLYTASTKFSKNNFVNCNHQLNIQFESIVFKVYLPVFLQYSFQSKNVKKYILYFQIVSCDETSSEAHKWFAIVLGSRGEYLGIKEKILDGFEFKKHIDRASELAPQDHTIRHLLGRWNLTSCYIDSSKSLFWCKYHLWKLYIV